MRPEDKPGIEPLSDASWQRIERGVFQQVTEVERREAEPPSSKRPRYTYALVLAGATALVVGFAAWRLGGPPVGVQPYRVVTLESGTHVDYGEAALDVASQSTLLVSGSDDRGVFAVLDRGKVTCELAPRRGRPPFIVQAGDVRVRVVGTKFTVSRSGDLAEVSVEHGVVEVTAHGQTARVGAGEHWPFVVTSAVATPAAPAPIAPTPSAVRTVVPKHPVRVFHAKGPVAPETKSTLVVPPTAEGPSSPSTRPPSPQLPNVSDTPQGHYEHAARLEPTDPKSAIAIYRALAAQSGVWSQNALYAEGRLEAERGHRAEAFRILRSYLERFPGGPNIDDARHLLDRVR